MLNRNQYLDIKDVCIESGLKNAYYLTIIHQSQNSWTVGKCRICIQNTWPTVLVWNEKNLLLLKINKARRLWPVQHYKRKKKQNVPTHVSYTSSWNIYSHKKHNTCINHPDEWFCNLKVFRMYTFSQVDSKKHRNLKSKYDKNSYGN